jgi:microsomal dipeptidase-like Zn-dependent dipeptidase
MTRFIVLASALLLALVVIAGPGGVPQVSAATTCPPGSNIIMGTPGNDVLVGTPVKDCILGGAGNDTLDGGAGDDTLIGGVGDDVIFGGGGNDTLDGEDGNDQLDGGNGDDTLYGGAGNDLLNGGFGFDRLEGGPGNDVLSGGNGTDVLRGDDGDDVIDSGPGNDDVSGGPGQDACQGSACEAPEPALTTCASNAECGGGTHCVSHVCLSCLGNAECADVNLCTSDVCTPLVGCGNQALPDGSSCADADVCNGDEVCKNGACLEGHPPHCDDGQFCNGPEACKVGRGCVTGPSPEVDDGDACTVDTCDEASDSIVHTRDDAACGRLWGFADLHAHPATNYAFGADADGQNGLFYGSPGLALDVANPTADLPWCAWDSHSGLDLDHVRHGIREKMLQLIDNVSAYAHEAQGYPSYANWPAARSLTHQQMHVTMLRRAYDGGLRLLVADVTENQFLTTMWRDIGYTPAGNPVPLADPAHDYESAKRQITFIKSLVAANPTWMGLAKSAAEARAIVADNRLAVILGVEMDWISPHDTLRLVDEEGVRHVIPVHLINNDVGGTALYLDPFNTVNAYVHATRNPNNWNILAMDGFFTVEYDTRLKGRLGRPNTLLPVIGDLGSGGAISPEPISDAAFAALAYDAPPEFGGHKNAMGITEDGEVLIQQLARKGVLIDVAHMGEKTTEWTLQEFARAYRYPMMDSHTGIRDGAEMAENERSLKRSHLQTIAELGGVIGFGTEGVGGPVPILSQPAIPDPAGGLLVRFTATTLTKEWSGELKRPTGNPVISNLTVSIKTAGDDLRGGANRVWADVGLPSGIYEVDLSKGDPWPQNSTRTVSFALPTGTRADDISSFALRTVGYEKNGPTDEDDNWQVESLMVLANIENSDTVRTWLERYDQVRQLMKLRGGVALGTDMNGFAPQLSFAADSVSYPLMVASQTGNPRAPLLPRAALGTRTYDFKTDGLAHYGMLSDFMQALSDKPGSGADIDALFHSAEATIRMWEACEAAAPGIPEP